jgi:hypothetical protein
MYTCTRATLNGSSSLRHGVIGLKMEKAASRHEEDKQKTVITVFTSVFVWRRGLFVDIFMIFRFIGLNRQKHYSWPAENFSQVWQQNNAQFRISGAIPVHSVTNSQGILHSTNSLSRTYSFPGTSNLAITSPTSKKKKVVSAFEFYPSSYYEHTFFKIQFWTNFSI